MCLTGGRTLHHNICMAGHWMRPRCKKGRKSSGSNSAKRLRAHRRQPKNWSRPRFVSSFPIHPDTYWNGLCLNKFWTRTSPELSARYGLGEVYGPAHLHMLHQPRQRGNSRVATRVTVSGKSPGLFFGYSSWVPIFLEVRLCFAHFSPFLMNRRFMPGMPSSGACQSIKSGRSRMHDWRLRASVPHSAQLC
jgi:hypothetical protein